MSSPGKCRGSSLFPTYTNDMSKCCLGLSVVHFAADTTVFASASHLDKQHEFMIHEALVTERWLCCNTRSLLKIKSLIMTVIPGVPVSSVAQINVLDGLLDGGQPSKSVFTPSSVRFTGALVILRRCPPLCRPIF